MFVNEELDSGFFPGRNRRLGDLFTELGQKGKINPLVLGRVLFVRIYFQSGIDEHMGNIVVVVIQGIGHGDERNRGQRPSERSGANEIVGPLENFHILPIADILGEDIRVPAKDSQKGHEVFLHVVLLLTNVSSHIEVLNSQDIPVSPVGELYVVGDSEVGEVEGLFLLHHLDTEVESEDSKGRLVVDFEQVRIFFNDLEQ